MWIDVINRCGALQTNQKYQNSITLLNALQMAGVIVHIQSAYTQQWTHPEQWAAILLQRPESRCGALLKGTPVVVLKVERAVYIHSPHLQFLPGPRLKPATFRLWVRLSNQ